MLYLKTVFIKLYSRKALSSLVEEDLASDHLGKLNTNKSIGPDGIYSQLMRELAEVIAEPLSVFFETSQKLGRYLSKSNVTSVFKKGKKKEPENYRPISDLTPSLGGQ